MAGYADVDRILEECERIGAKLKFAITAWTATGVDKGKGTASREGSAALADDLQEDGALSLRSRASFNVDKKNRFLSQPSLLSDSVTLKEYQLLGVNWLHLLYNRKLSCILADEMGRVSLLDLRSRESLTRMSRSRKDCTGHQFLCSVERTGDQRTPSGRRSVSAQCVHYDILALPDVSSSTLENWCREFAKFAPTISVQTYYAGKEERPMLRQTLLDTRSAKVKDGWEVLITTYALAQGDERDRSFFKKVPWEVRMS
jgi:SWI/SNF-related matrix-associated actin-dependent regulator 1 of chromatin subfamily A